MSAARSSDAAARLHNMSRDAHAIARALSRDHLPMLCLTVTRDGTPPHNTSTVVVWPDWWEESRCRLHMEGMRGIWSCTATCCCTLNLKHVVGE